MAGKDGRFYGAAHHALQDTYVLQVFEDGKWDTVRGCTKQGGANAARSCAKRDNLRYRVYNVTKKKVYVECG